MNSSASFVKSLLAQCCLGGICEWVVCPGARNVALLQVLAAAEDLVKWTHFDERSAAFFALGRIQDMGLPVAVVTTSGTAAAELLPAVVEAYYQRRPLLLLTADRPAACRGSAAPQAIEQADLFGIYAPTIDLEMPESCPGVPSDCLDPREMWNNKTDYDRNAFRLAEAFRKNFEKYSDMPANIVNAGPRVTASRPQQGRKPSGMRPSLR